MKKRLLNGELITFTDIDDNLLRIWCNKKTADFCLMLNGKVIKATKTWPPIKTKLDTYRGLLEEVTL